MRQYQNIVLFVVTLLLVIVLERPCFAQEYKRDFKHQPELATIVRNWAEKLGGELWHFGELVTRRNMVIESYKRTSVVTEDGDALLKDMAEKIKKMMDDKVAAVERIMEVAENKAVMQGDDVEPSFDFFNAKNLYNSAPNDTMQEQEDIEVNAGIENLQMLRQNLENEYGHADGYERKMEQYRSVIHSGGNKYNYQQDQSIPESEEKLPHAEHIPKSEEIEVTDGSEQDAQASQIPPINKRFLPLYRNPHFYSIPVNTNHSAVHVPSNVYDRSKEVIKGIKWSEELDNTFKHNYEEDPTLSWQYFGSSTGFMRQFPAMIWSQEPVDLFDCRTRSWYIEAASSPKDIIILVDRSGSMTGMRREIARHVVNNILDTLGNNDYVNIFTFSNTTEPLIECFDEMLVQANLANVRALKEAMSDFRTEQIANFSLALTTAFRLLQDYREKKLGAQCNQAIMLITDGVQYNYKEIFKEYNWQNLPFMPVRVFTYLIGREVSDVREVKWMACANQGYYVHLSTISEVREQVLQYIPVMARPMVLNPTVKPNPTWSPVYADVTDPKLTNWLWVTRERNKQRDRFLLYHRNKTLFIPDEQDRKYVRQQKAKLDNHKDMQIYRLMTSVSLPVYDRRPNATRVANLLGVAGTDVPIEYIQRLMAPYRLGVNGYAFIVTNNGYILIHPDLRPVFQGILKPAYNRVDMLEVEVMDDDSEPRDFDDSLVDLRKSVVMQAKGHVMLRVKTHLDDLRRIIISNRHYYYMGINNTPFSIVVALPDRYGFSRVQYALEDEIHRMRSNNKIKGPTNQFFTGNWTIHPDWLYCKYNDDKHRFDTPEDELLHFLGRIDQAGWKWSGASECDSKLIKSLVADAKMTEWFNQNITTSGTKDENGHEFIKRFGITVAFLSTYSGLTRWQDFPQNIGDRDVHDEPHFHQLHNKAIDEVWYKRAVEQHFIEPRSFVYSVPFDIGNENHTVVTASHAIFKEDGVRKAPAAVVGFQFYHSALHMLFTKITSNCGDIQCKRTCISEELYCLVLDDNGYVIVSDNRDDTGRFFGEIRRDIMAQLLDEGVYKPNRMYDYQATCFRSTDAGNPASKCLTYLTQFAQILRWIQTTLTLLLTNFVNGIEYETYDPHTIEHESIRLEKLTAFACDNEFWIYKINLHDYQQINSEDCLRPYIAQNIRYTNLLLLIIDETCPSTPNRTVVHPLRFQKLEYHTERRCLLGENNFYRRDYTDCFNDETVNPFKQLYQITQWAFATLVYLIKSTWATEIYPTFDPEQEGMEESDSVVDEPHFKSNEKEFDRRLLINKTRPEACDQEMFLYTLGFKNTTGEAFNKSMSNNCTRPFVIQPVIGSNMILLVINNICLEEPKSIPMPDPQEINYNTSLTCFRVRHESFPRRNYMSCINRSIHEREIELCGRGTILSVPFILLLLVLVIKAL